MATKFDYAEAAQDAYDMLDEFGGPMKIRRTGTSPTPGPDPWDPQEPGAGTDTDYDVVGVLLDYENKDVDGTMIKQGDRQAIVSANNDVEFSTNDLLVATENDVYTIVDPQPLKPNPAAVTVLWTLQIRK